MIIAGIDPGKEGGVALLQNGGIAAEPVALPYHASELDTRALATILDIWSPDRVVVELQQIRPMQGGAMTIGSNFGRILAVLELADLPYLLITPGTWKRRANIKASLKGRQAKDAAFAVAQRRWGGDFSRLGLRRTQDGLVEAMLIAEYGLPA